MPRHEAAFPFPPLSWLESTIPSNSAVSRPLADLSPLLASEECGPKESAELRSIIQENDPELRQAALRHFAGLQEGKGRLAYATAAYEILLSAGEDETAQKRLAALRGGGDFGDRAELLLRDFFIQALQPEMLGGMAVGSLVGQSLRAFSLAGLLQTSPTYWTRGFGARTLASGLGLLGEVPAVVASAKGIHQLRGKSVDWNSAVLAQEGLSLGISLSLLKGGNVLSRRLSANLGTSHALLPRLGTSLLPGVTATTALYTAHRMESAWGLRPASDPASALAESVAMFFQFQLSGRFLHAATGGGLARGLAGLEMRSQLAGEPRFPEGPAGRFELEFAGVPARRGQQQPFDLTEPQTLPVKKLPVDKLLMSSMGGNGAGQEFLYRRLLQRLAPRLGVQESDPRLRLVVDNYWGTPFPRSSEQARANYFDLLTRTELKGTNFLEGREIPAVDLMTGAGFILRRAMEMNSFRTGMGSFYDFLTQVAFEQTLATRRVPVFDALVQTLTVEPSQSSLETFFQKNELHHPFTRQRIGSGRSEMDLQPWLRKLENYPLSEGTRWWLAEYLVSYSRGLFSTPFRDPTYNFYYNLDPTNRTARPMTTDEVFHSLDEMFADRRFHEVWRKGLEQVAERASRSPIPLLYFDRFFKLRSSGDLPEKIPELMTGPPYHLLEALQMGPSGRSLNETVYTAYISDPILAEKFRKFYQVLPELIHPAGSEIRLAEYQLKAKSLLDTKLNFDRKDILELLYHRPTALAAEARQAILRGDVELEVLTRAGMEMLMKALRPGQPIHQLHDALYLPASKSPTGRAYIAILQLDPLLSREEKIARAPFLAACAVHEYEHHRQAGEFDLKQRSHRLKAEMRAWLEESLYLLTQGEKTVWEEADLVSPDGFATYLRSLIERQYLHSPHPYLLRSGKPSPDSLN